MADPAPQLLRSVLYVPAVRERAVDKARVLACDVIVLDLEDAVGPQAKDQARAAAVAALAAGGFGRRRVGIRCNSLDTPWVMADLDAARAAGADFVVVPKVAGPADIEAAVARLGPDGPRLWAMIETCQAVLALAGICRAGGRLEGLMLGTNDLAAQMRCRTTVNRGALLPILTQAVVAARAYGLHVIDGTFNDLTDPEGLAMQCRQGADLGFDGKTVIHPDQIEIANAIFGPTVDAVEEARAIIAAFEAAPEAGVIAVEGRMVERLHLNDARRIVALADEIDAREA